MAFGMTLFAAASCLMVMRLTIDPGAQTAVLYSAVLATGNGLCALFLSHSGARRQSTKDFFRAVFGGMFLRTGATLIGLVVGLKFLLLPPAEQRREFPGTWACDP